MKQYLKTTLFLGILTGMFMAVGFYMGGRTGALIALGLAALFNIGTFWFSSSLVLKMQRAKPLNEAAHPEIARMIRELAHDDNLPVPKMYWVDTPIPNAFATGRSPKHGVVAVTSGIVDILERHELRAVLAHELGHIKNRDMLVSTIAATVAGALSFVVEIGFWFGGFFGSDEEGNNPIGGILLLLFTPFIAMLIQMAVSRSREYLADKHGAHLHGNPEDLASALLKLDNFKHSHRPVQPHPTDQATAHLMFVNMFSGAGVLQLLSTHPSTHKRVEVLRSMKGLR